MAMLKRVEIHGYRSIKDADLELRRLNVFIGANGAGKSNFVSFFKMLNEMMAGRLQEYIGRSGRGQSFLHFGPKTTPQFEARLEFELGDASDNYSLRLIHAAGDTLLFAEETLDYKKANWDTPHNQPMSLGAGHAETRIGELTRDLRERIENLETLFDLVPVGIFLLEGENAGVFASIAAAPI